VSSLPHPALSGDERDSRWRTIVIAVIAVMAIMLGIAFVFRQAPRTAEAPPPYITNLKFSDLKMSAAENFVGSTVTYVEGNIANTGGQTVTSAAVHVVFKNSLGEIVQAEDVPLQVVQQTSLYLDSVNLSAAPLAPGRTKPFRLTFEHVSADWDHAYPNLQVTRISVR
jgi:hypothetical protein